LYLNLSFVKSVFSLIENFDFVDTPQMAMGVSEQPRTTSTVLVIEFPLVLQQSLTTEID